jgi:RNA polymerase sigma-70 factor (ECF subfamily)
MADLEPSFTAQRARLLAIAYRMVGSTQTAEDLVQEAWLRVRDIDAATVQSPPALLRKVVMNLCLDHLKSARQARESYIGPWLPEPVRAEPDDTPSADERIDEVESLSMAFLLILETLSPLERAVFLLREVFDYDFDEIGAALGRSAAACRQLFHRAREHVDARRTRYRVAKAQHTQVMTAFLAATMSGDVAELSRLLCEDVVATSDGGGQARAARKEILGRDRVSRFVAGLSQRGFAGATYELDWMNGHPALLAFVEGQLKLVMIVESDGAQVTALRFVLAPDKLRGLVRSLR